MNMVVANELMSVRVDADVAANMLLAVASELPDGRIKIRLETDQAFGLLAIRMAQEITVATTLAQSIRADQDFAAMLKGRLFSDGDPALKKLGREMVAWIAALDRLPDAELSDDLVECRFIKLLALI